MENDIWAKTTAMLSAKYNNRICDPKRDTTLLAFFWFVDKICCNKKKNQECCYQELKIEYLSILGSIIP